MTYISNILAVIQRNLLTLSVYTAIINSYALFIVYPCFKSGSFYSILICSIIYIILLLPLFALLKQYILHNSSYRLISVVCASIILSSVIVYFSHPVPLMLFVAHVILYTVSAMAEETLWRGEVWTVINNKVNNKFSTLLLVTGHFALLHIPFALAGKDAPVAFIMQVAALGLVLGLLKLVTNQIHASVATHAIVNVLAKT